ncbi:hypothetical protein BC828DRAFT_372719 [Blastocladiella britannica]|nr:hypothetical protein BC828DRAFT_372719 [Blastocladiella britannica]
MRFCSRSCLLFALVLCHRYCAVDALQSWLDYSSHSLPLLYSPVLAEIAEQVSSSRPRLVDQVGVAAEMSLGSYWIGAEIKLRDRALRIHN